VRIDRRAQFPDLTSERRLWKIALCLRRRVEPFFLGQYKAYDVVVISIGLEGIQNQGTDAAIAPR